MVPTAVLDACRQLLSNESLDPAFRAQALALLGVLERMGVADPAALRTALIHLAVHFGRSLKAEWPARHGGVIVPGPYPGSHPRLASRQEVSAA